MNLIFGLIAPVLLSVGSRSTDAPIHFETCSRRSENFKECISTAITHAVHSISQGSKFFKIRPLKEYKIQKISHTMMMGDYQLKQIMKDVVVYGLTDELTTECEYIDRDLRAIRFSTYTTYIDFLADYTGIGHFPNRPEFSKVAHVAMMTESPRIEHIMKSEKYERNGTEFLKVVKYKIRTSCDTVSYEFVDNFGMPIHEFNDISDHEWSTLFAGITKKLELKMASFFKNMANKIFSRVPVNLLFPD